MSFRRSSNKIVFAVGTVNYIPTPGAKLIKVWLVGGGQSGGGQCVVAAGGNTSGLGTQGGHPGGFSFFEFPGDMLKGLVIPVTVGAGGAALTASAALNTVGVAGNAGANSIFGQFLVARGGISAAPGRSMLANTNSGTTGNTWNSNTGNSSTSVTNPSLLTASGGGSAQPITTGVPATVGAGSAGNDITCLTPSVGGNVPPGANAIKGGIAGISGARNGANGNTFGVDSIMGGSGGGAGFTDLLANGGNGGAGGFPGGGGGAAGVGLSGSFSSGISGAGGNGTCVVIEIF